MRKLLILAVVLFGAGAYAATAISGSGEKVSTGPPVTKEAKRISAGEARAAGVNAARVPPRARFQFFVARRPTIVPADGVTSTTSLLCPKKRSAVAGFFRTDRAIAVDFFRASGRRRWQFGFTDLAGVEGRAWEGVVCGPKGR